VKSRFKTIPSLILDLPAEAIAFSPAARRGILGLALTESVVIRATSWFSACNKSNVVVP